MSVWDDIVGQETVVEVLRSAVAAAVGVLAGRPDAGGAMTHAWLFTGPPGSGRSNAARAFAAALQCDDGGCGTCLSCHTVRTNSHADVDVVSTRLLSIGVDAARGLVSRAALSPAGRKWQVIVLEDADRLTEAAANALLKAIEEPTPRTVWLLCAPSLEDVLPTIRSRCRHLGLRTPPSSAVAAVLVRRDGVDPAMAAFAARASQGHIGRARRLATDEAARLRRAEVLRLPTSLASLGDCITAAANLVDATREEAREISDSVDATEHDELARALGAGSSGRGLATGGAKLLKDLESEQKRRATRTQRDTLDRALVDLAAFYRDVLAVQIGAGVELVNEEMRPAIMKVAGGSTAEQTVRRIDAVLAAREAVDTNVAPLIAMEAMTLALRTG